MTNGLVVMTPSSIAYSGTSASINADGSVVFSACTSLSLNGVFTSDYDNYMVAIRHKCSTTQTNLDCRMRASGTDATGANYTRQLLTAASTSVTGARDSSVTTFRVGAIYDAEGGDTFYMFGPNLSQPTAVRTVNSWPYLGSSLRDWAGTHSLSSSYDGITISVASGNLTGLITVFGFNQ